MHLLYFSLLSCASFSMPCLRVLTVKAAVFFLLREKEFLPELGLHERVLYIMNQHMEGH